ncbi:MAG: hypothetical protein QOI31_2368 [Solirubrobacterales bacterium]|nr:hypothetical protein [Solirubrobacterales bacterium]
MLPTSKDRILAAVSENDLVLDVGGWAHPLSRADWVIDLMPYETRGLYGDKDPDPERFSQGTWVERDICDRKPWPFSDDQFDFVICSHTLEDVRDPIWVCNELSRVARAGYVEVPSRLEEQTFGIHGPWVGWSHHRWLIDLDQRGLTFVFKSHALHGSKSFRFPEGFADTLSAEERVHSYFWEGRIEATERIFLTAEEHDDYVSRPIRQGGGQASGGRLKKNMNRAKRLVARSRSRLVTRSSGVGSGGR